MSFIKGEDIPGIIAPSEVMGKLPSSFISISTDSRKKDDCNTFLGITGDRFNPTDMVDQYISQFDTFIFNEKDRHKISLHFDSGKTFFFVTNTIKALQQLGTENLSRWKTPGKYVFTLTGSNGKTTTKEMTAHLLNHLYPGVVSSTRGNFNNHIGVPLTLLQLKKTDEYLVCEIGTNHPGEISALCDLISPNIGLVTNIGSAHIEFLGSEGGVFQEKRQLYEHIKKSKEEKRFFLINKQDRFLKTLSGFDYTQSLGKSDSDYLFSQSNRNYCLKCTNDKITWPVNLLSGEHNHYNMAAALAWIKGVLGVSFDLLLEGVLTFKPGLNRSQWIEKNGLKIFMDCYNANPSSMEVSLRTFTEVGPPQESLVVVGDMYELGEKTQLYHRQIGELCRSLKIENMVFVGKFASDLRDGYSKDCLLFSSTEELMQEWPALLKNKERVFLKGSNSLQLHRVLDINF